jgi:hypothetical protein
MQVLVMVPAMPMWLALEGGQIVKVEGPVKLEEVVSSLVEIQVLPVH